MSTLEAFPGHLTGKMRDVSDEFLRPEDRFTEEERARPRLNWLRPSAKADEPVERAPEPSERVRRRAWRFVGGGQGRGQSGHEAFHHHRAHGSALAEHGHGPSLQGLTVDVVSSYVSSNPLPSVDLPALILQVHSALSDLSAMPDSGGEELREKASPAQIRRSITPDALISFIDGRPYKTLKRHLAAHGLDIEGYRRRYGLPADYPMVAANYSAARAALAKSIGLGRNQDSEEAPPPRKKVFARPGRRRKEKAA